MSASVRLQATGPRGEACIVVKTCSDIHADALSGRAMPEGLPSYRLATGERLNPTSNPAVFETLDRRRAFTLRQ